MARATDWQKIEQMLDDQSVKHSCCFCGDRIAAGDERRWSLAVRQLTGATTVVWCHPQCFVDELDPTVRKPFEKGGPAAPLI